MPTLDSAIFARALQAMQSALAQKEIVLLVASHESSAAAETQAARAARARRRRPYPNVQALHDRYAADPSVRKVLACEADG